MSEFDFIINENSFLTKAVQKVGQTFDIAKNFYTSGSLKNLAIFLSNNKSKFSLEFVNNLTAEKALKDLKVPVLTTTTAAESSSVNVFSPTAVMMDDTSGFTGLKGQLLDYKNAARIPEFKLFKQRFEGILEEERRRGNELDINIDDLIAQTSISKKFWIKISPKTPITATESFDNLLDYGYSMLNESKVVPPNETEYATWFIYNSPNPQINLKFKITYANQKPNPNLGSMFRVDDARGYPSGLLQVGQNTLYPKWYFLNDLVKAMKEENKEKIQQPKGISLPNYGGDEKIV